MQVMAVEYRKLIRRIWDLSQSKTTENLLFELEKIDGLEYEIHEALKSGKGEDSISYDIVVGLYYDFDTWDSFGEDTVESVAKFKSGLARYLIDKV